MHYAFGPDRLSIQWLRSTYRRGRLVEPTDWQEPFLLLAIGSFAVLAAQVAALSLYRMYHGPLVPVYAFDTALFLIWTAFCYFTWIAKSAVNDLRRCRRFGIPDKADIDRHGRAVLSGMLEGAGRLMLFETTKVVEIDLPKAEKDVDFIEGAFKLWIPSATAAYVACASSSVNVILQKSLFRPAYVRFSIAAISLFLLIYLVTSRRRFNELSQIQIVLQEKLDTITST